jgi:putative peptide zinc metalloprotease protein
MPTTAQLAALTVVADGDTYIVGSPHTAEYVEVPELGAQIVAWLQRGLDVPECERRAAELAGEPVDVEDFLTTLADEGLLGAAAPATEAARWRRLGTVLFHPAAWIGYGLVALAGPVLLLAVPALRPSYRDGFPFSTQLLNILVVSLLGMAAVAIHEGAHVLATAALGLRSRLSVSRRLYFLTFQADLTRLWSVPRRQRYGPLLAGVTWDAVIMALAIGLQATLADQLGPVAVRLLRALVLLQFTALIAQALVFMRTDVYALLVNATGCTTLWATKGALLRRLLRRASPDDERQLADAGPREVTWARRYLWLYVPGILVAVGYLLYFLLPSLPHMIELCVAPIRADGLTTLAAWEGAAALTIAVVPSLLALIGAVRSGLRVLATLTRRRLSGADDPDRAGRTSDGGDDQNRVEHRRMDALIQDAPGRRH